LITISTSCRTTPARGVVLLRWALARASTSPLARTDARAYLVAVLLVVVLTLAVVFGRLLAVAGVVCVAVLIVVGLALTVRRCWP